MPHDKRKSDSLSDTPFKFASLDLHRLHERDERGYSPLMCAIENDDLGKVRTILAHDPGESSLLFDLTLHKFQTPLTQAARLKQPEILKLLLEHLLKLSHLEIHTAYHAQDRNGKSFHNYISQEFLDDDKVFSLLNEIASLASKEITDFSKREYRLKVQTALKTKFQKNINQPNHKNETPLMEMIRKENIDMIEWLLSHPNIDLSLKDEFGENALMQAALNYARSKKKDPAILILLLKHLNTLPVRTMAEIYDNSDLKKYGINISIMKYLYPTSEHNKNEDPELYQILGEVHKKCKLLPLTHPKPDTSHHSKRCKV